MYIRWLILTEPSLTSQDSMPKQFESKVGISQEDLEKELREMAFLKVVGDIRLIHVNSFELPLDEIAPLGGISDESKS